MMKTTLILSVIVLALVFTGCSEDEDPMKESSMFKVSIENVMEPKDFLSSGVFNTPAGTMDPGPLLPGNMYSFSLDAGTEVNEIPGVGLHQPARLNGGMDEMGNVRTLDDMYTYPSVSDAVKITITPI